MRNVMLIGDGKGVTVITGHKSFLQGGNTWSAATIVIWGDGFVARDITFQNTAGSGSHQAPALTSKAPHSAFYRCAFEGYQDTVYAQHGLQFYRECDIYGSVDFICGDAAVVIQNSNIYLRRSSTGNELTIAASSRESSNSATGIVFQNCRITAAPDLKPVLNSYEIYLGRPWKSYSRTVYIHSDFDVPVEPRGWLEWAGNVNTNTAYYREFGNRGVGSSTGGRVKWPSVKASPVITSEANQFTVGNFIHGNSWLPSTGVPFTPGL
ncbi:pectinesterase [Sarracenia purpurea var. burkii]